MKNTIKHAAYVFLFVVAAAPAFASGVDWNADPMTQAREALIQAQREHPIATPASRVVATAKAPASIEVYEGEMTVGGKRVSLRLRLSTEDYDQYAGDPDMSQGVYVSRQGRLAEDGVECATAWERNGDYLPECSGLFLTGLKDAVENGLARGDVFARLDRFDPATGRLAVQPVGRFTLRKVAAPAVIVAATPAGSYVHPYADDLVVGDVTGRVDAYLSKDHGKILVDFDACNERFDDCAGLRFVFSQLRVDLASKTVKLGSETVATLPYDAATAQAIKDGRFYFGEDGIDHSYEVKWAAGWELSYRTEGSRVLVALSKRP